MSQLRDKVRDLEVCLETTRSQLRDKDAHLEEQKRKERDLLTTITEYVRDVTFFSVGPDVLKKGDNSAQ